MEDGDDGRRRRRRAATRDARATGRNARRRTLDGGLDEEDEDLYDEGEAKTTVGRESSGARSRAKADTPGTTPVRRGKARRARPQRDGPTPRKDSLGMDSVGAFWSTDRKSKSGARRTRKLMLGDVNADDENEDDDEEGEIDNFDDGEDLAAVENNSKSSSPAGASSRIKVREDAGADENKSETTSILLLGARPSPQRSPSDAKAGDVTPRRERRDQPGEAGDPNDSDDSDAQGIRDLISASQDQQQQPLAGVPRSALRRSPRHRRSPRSAKSVRFSVQKVKTDASLSPRQRTSVSRRSPASVKTHHKSASRLGSATASSRKKRSSEMRSLLRPDEQEDALVAFGGENEENEEMEAASLAPSEAPLEATNMLDVLADTEIQSSSDEGELGTQIEEASEDGLSRAASSPAMSLTPVTRRTSPRVTSSGRRTRATTTPLTARSSRASSATYTSGAATFTSTSSSSSTGLGRTGDLATPVSFSFRDAPGSSSTRRSSARRDDDDNDSEGGATFDASYRTAERKPRRVMEPVFDPSKEAVTPGRRRSRRKRWAVLEHWKGERLIQQRKRDKRLGIYIDEVVGAEKAESFVTPAPPKRKRQRTLAAHTSGSAGAPPKKKSASKEVELIFEDATPVYIPSDVRLQSSASVVTHQDPITEDLVDSVVVRRASEIELEHMPGDEDASFTNSKKEVVQASSAMAGAAFEDDRFICGVCELPPLCSKPIEGSMGFTQIFVVTEAQAGAVVVQIEDNCYKLSAGDHFWVPRFTSYGLRNFSESKRARINFTLIKPSPGPAKPLASPESNAIVS